MAEKLEERKAIEPSRYSPRFRGEKAWVWLSAPALLACVAGSTSLGLSEPQFPHLQNGNNTVTYFIGLWSRFIEIMPAKCLA